MQQRYPCPKCGVPVEYGCRFCGHCGNTINWGAPPPYPPPPPQQPPYGYPNQQQWGQQQPPPQQPPYGGYPNQQQWGQQQPGWNQPPRQGNPPHFQQQNTFGAQGNQQQKKTSSSMLIFLVILIVVVFTIGGFALATNGFSSTNKPTSSTPPVTTETPPVTPPPASNNTTQTTTTPTSNLPVSQSTQITADELIAAYSGDITGAKAKYEGNRYAISGKVSAVNSSAPPFIYFKGSKESPYEIQFSFSQGQESNVSDRNIGDSINIEGKVVNYLGTIIIVDDCKFVK
jgi:hypothetical protein